MGPKLHSLKPYLFVYVALLVLLGLTIGAAEIDFGRAINFGIALGIAILKGLLIVIFFMHVRDASRLTWFFAGAGFLWLGIMIGLTMSDYLTRNHPPDTSPKGEPVFLSSDRLPGPP